MTVYHVFANRSNVGDWLSAIGIQSTLGVPVVELLCDDPFVEASIEVLGSATQEDVVVIGGGGLFMDYFEPFWRGLAAMAGNARIAVWGAGLVDLKREDSRLDATLVIPIVERAELCAVRDELTRAYLSAVAGVRVTGCSSLTAVAPPGRAGWGVLHSVNYTTVGEEEYERMRRVAMQFAAGTGRPYRETNNRIEQGSDAALQRVLGMYADSDIVIASALHGCVIAAGMGRQIVAVSGDRKIEGFMGAAGLRRYALDFRDVDELGRLLEDLGAQTSTAPYVAATRRANEEIAQEVLHLLEPSDQIN